MHTYSLFVRSLHKTVEGNMTMAGNIMPFEIVLRNSGQIRITCEDKIPTLITNNVVTLY